LPRSGFTEEDISSISDRLIDAIIAWGDEDAILRRIDEHRRRSRPRLRPGAHR
jgi:hypothetical protein